MSFKIKAVAKSIPKKVVTNDDLTKLMDTSDEWIQKRTGIKQRHVVTDERNTTLAIDVAEKLIAQSRVTISKINYIIVATMSPEYQMPSTAAMVQGAVGAINAIAFDISAACSGFVYGVSVLNSLLAKQPGGVGIIIGSEQLSRLIDWSDRSTAVLFGDGAAGILVENDGSDARVLSEDLKTQGADGQCLTAGKYPSQTPFSKTDGDPFFKMDGHAVYNFATKQVPISIKKAVQEAGLELDQIDCFVMHQANQRIVTRVAKKLDLDLAKFPINIDKYGNTAAASEPILLAELEQTGKIKRGDYLALTGFGGGLTVGTVIIKY
ncbi:beta-ketoacyl-ACP synthase III [Fructilactobacillus vespulae]|uniref:beta-ketoacyl-ACP synthase III n=1 Tax=Fructilactobacillus vespulae TaxID=1249630 RepID=UPI0039B5B7BE